MVKPKVPREPNTPLARNDGDIVEYADPVWRIHRTRGAHVLLWNMFRAFGPVASSRYDPHPPQRGIHPGFGIMYTACSVRTAVAEVFQTTRRVNTMTGAPCLTSWTPVRPLKLLDTRSRRPCGRLAGLGLVPFTNSGKTLMDCGRRPQ
ncbi:RES family NAD+ phosphorylase [Hoyosella sp. YIM 151337]|uniref:RES family NAD+ phosphorylase n=1 Tax=Hoyosella sp. YIM 151337 TaxID=2992742 RepID=UPI0022359259|nr:RES family NAD+ phosphorylase [Hoyosella sp. YIM 151337]MCW4353761.1 RES family NAD+ phosphorylase [Hoyosella sp. YIM 151337]